MKERRRYGGRGHRPGASIAPRSIMLNKHPLFSYYCSSPLFHTRPLPVSAPTYISWGRPKSPVSHIASSISQPTTVKRIFYLILDFHYHTKHARYLLARIPVPVSMPYHAIHSIVNYARDEPPRQGYAWIIRSGNPRKCMYHRIYQKARWEARFFKSPSLPCILEKILDAEKWEIIAGKREKNPNADARKETEGLLFVFGLVKEEVGGELFVLVTGEVGLDGLIPWESQTT